MGSEIMVLIEKGVTSILNGKAMLHKTFQFYLRNYECSCSTDINEDDSI